MKSKFLIGFKLLFFWFLFSKIIWASFVEKKIADDQYFVLEKLTNESLQYWEVLAELNEAKLAIVDEVRRKQIDKGFYYFREGLEFYKKLWRAGFPLIAWIAYVSDQPRLENQKPQFENIEMAVTVATAPNAWFFSPMGISRWLGSNKKHPNISLDFLSFAGIESKKQVPSLEYLITSPARSLFNLLKSQVPKESFFYYYKGTYDRKFDSQENEHFWHLHPVPTVKDKGFEFFAGNYVQRGPGSYLIAIPISFFEKRMLSKGV